MPVHSGLYELPFETEAHSHHLRSHSAGAARLKPSSEPAESTASCRVVLLASSPGGTSAVEPSGKLKDTTPSDSVHHAYGLMLVDI